MYSINPIKDRVIKLESPITHVSASTPKAELEAMRVDLKEISKLALELEGKIAAQVSLWTAHSRPHQRRPQLPRLHLSRL